MSINAIRDLTSIIIPCWNQVEFTQQCLAALKSHTREPWELIVIDNGSTDGTATYLAGVRDMSTVPVTVVSNATNLGFPAAINQGLRLARGDYLVMLNNDVVVTDGWLDQLIALVNAEGSSVVSGQWSVVADGKQAEREGLITPPTEQPHLAPPHDGDALHDGLAFEARVGDGTGPTPPGPPFTRGGKDALGQESSSLPSNVRPIGLVGPMSNYAAPPQLVEEVPYRGVAEMHGFATRWRNEHLGEWFTAPRLSGFCLLMRREVYETVGGLDERFGIGFFDDDDLAERARRAGFELAVAHDLFVHHFGSRTFAGNGIDAER
jgi:GT2 family glycosyltransferase